jgi:multidrug efflux system outer membrane protein
LAIQSAFSDVDSALASRSTLIDQQAAQEKLVKALRSYSRIAQLQFDIGRVPYSTVLQAEQELFPAELDWAADRAQLASSIVGIYKAMGGGWVAAADKLTAAAAPASVPKP